MRKLAPFTSKSSLLFLPVLMMPLIHVAARADGAAPAPAQQAKEIVQAFDRVFAGPRPAQRPVHSKGVMVRGTFTPSADAVGISKAAHFQQPVAILARFSNFAGIPSISDADADASPRGLAIRFLLPDGSESDLVTHSYNGFPAATPDEFLGFLTAVGSKEPGAMGAFLATHPAAQRFVETAKPAPVSYGSERFFGVNAFRFENAARVQRFGRYFIEPVVGPTYLSKEDAAAAAPDYLSRDMSERLKHGTVSFKLQLQIAEEGDQLTDGTQLWPQARRVVELGTLSFDTLMGDADQNEYLFTPLNLTDGIAPSADPMLSARSRAYRVSYDRRTASGADREAQR